jgi:hypothetical protein
VLGAIFTRGNIQVGSADIHTNNAVFPMHKGNPFSRPCDADFVLPE